jgi:hypothetical protein
MYSNLVINHVPFKVNSIQEPKAAPSVAQTPPGVSFISPEKAALQSNPSSGNLELYEQEL